LSSSSKEWKKAAIAAYKEKKVVAGIYAVRSRTESKVWVGSAPNLATVWNRLVFELQLGGCRCRSLQQAWNLQSGEGFDFETLESIDAEALSFAAERVMKERLQHWSSALAAERLP
jgi:hypothetical protein